MHFKKLFLAMSLIVCAGTGYAQKKMSPLPATSSILPNAELAFPKLPARFSLDANARAFYEKAFFSTLTAQQSSDLLITYETDIKEIYVTLGIALTPLAAKTSLSPAEANTIFQSTKTAMAAMDIAAQKLLSPFNFSPDELKAMHLLYVYINPDIWPFPPRPAEGMYAIKMLYPVEFREFLAGLCQKTGIFVDIISQYKLYGNTTAVLMPIYAFNKNAVEHESRLPDEIVSFLNGPYDAAFRKTLDDLYDSKITHFQQVDLEGTNAYTFDGAVFDQIKYGENNVLEPDGRIFLYTQNIRRSTKNRPQFTSAFADSIKIHEVMHALHRRKCQPATLTSEITWNGLKVKASNFDEAQAVISTILMFANQEEYPLPYKESAFHYILLTNVPHGQARVYFLAFDLFFKELFLRTAQAQYKEHRNYYRSDAKMLARLPSFLLSRNSADLAKANGVDQGHILDILNIDGKDISIVVDLMNLDLGQQIELLYHAKREDVLEIGKTALAKIVEGEQALCPLH